MPARVILDDDSGNELICMVKNHPTPAFVRTWLGMKLLNLAHVILPFDFLVLTAPECECEAGFACGEVPPYGFVAEDGCPIHDVPHGIIEIDLGPDAFESQAEWEYYVRKMREMEGDYNDASADYADASAPPLRDGEAKMNGSEYSGGE